MTLHLENRGMNDFVLTTPFIVMLSLSFSVFLYLLGSTLSHKVKTTVDKLSSYACGEDLPAERSKVNVRQFFMYITFFMVFDVSAFMLATSFSSPGVYPLLFCVIVLLAVVTLLPLWREKHRGLD
jgi:NADH:ubiquinone oxidoreductase subunit 3 (subunit A)